MTIANQLIAPVGPGGLRLVDRLAPEPPGGSVEADGSHPSAEGTYLAACVFFAVLFRQSPGKQFLPGQPAGRHSPLSSKTWQPELSWITPPMESALNINNVLWRS